jgi:hypothetical protein
MRSLTAGPVRLVMLLAALAAAPVGQAAAQPDPAPRVHAESVEVNLTQHPTFQFVVQIPTALRFESLSSNGQLYLHIWAYSLVDSLQARITKAASYQAARPGIFTPLIDPPNRNSNLASLYRLRFEQALRDLKPERRLSYHRRLS